MTLTQLGYYVVHILPCSQDLARRHRFIIDQRDPSCCSLFVAALMVHLGGHPIQNIWKSRFTRTYKYTMMYLSPAVPSVAAIAATVAATGFVDVARELAVAQLLNY